MKTRFIKISTSLIKKLIILSLVFLVSCNEMEFLKEVPLDFYSPNNSYITSGNFRAALDGIYSYYRSAFYSTSLDGFSSPRLKWVGTDLIGHDQRAYNLQDLLTPSNDFVRNVYWAPCYRIIYDANVIIGRSELESAELTPAEKVKIQAEARFFRGFMYEILADVYGGVPIVLEETTEPKRDYVRASREETYQQALDDLKYAAENLPGITDVKDYTVSNLVAYHMLSVVYLSLEQWDNAVNAASKVIDDPNTDLMTVRFGSRVNDTYNALYPWASGGDPYWDLFRIDNQNRSSGNKETLWAIQFKYNVTGGMDGGYGFESTQCPRTWMLKVKNKNGKSVNLLPYPNTYYGGKGTGAMKISNYYYEDIWNRSGYTQDRRNSSYNIIRDVTVPNPACDYYGKWLFKDKVPLISYDQNRDWFPIVAKAACMGDHPLDNWVEDQTVYGSILSAGGVISLKQANVYEARLAETYLIRAEAYWRKGEKQLAADDINVIRRRSLAPDITAANVNIDYILDERARELMFEENRMRTLHRLNLLVERNNLYNPDFDYYPHQNLWPIPFSEIEKNTAAELTQNPGY